MPWIPSFTVDGGLFAGQAFPYGSLTGFINDYPNNPTALVNGLYCGQSQTTLGWDGSFGAAGDQLVAYGLDHKDNTYHYFDGIILDVKNPEGAQFYKQQLVIEMYVGFSTEMTSTVTIGSEQISVTYVSGTFGIRNIWRRVYDTPYSTPTQTVLAGAARDITFTYVISGDIRALPRGYNSIIFGKLYVPLAFGTYAGNDTEYFGCGLYLQFTDAASNGYTKAAYVGVKHDVINDVFMIDFEPEVKEDPNEEDPPEDGPGKGGGGGGYGDHVLPDGPVLIPPIPGLGSCSPSWLRTYMMDKQDIDEFGQELVDPTPMQQLKAYFADPLDAIVGITLCPCIPEGPRYAYTPQIHGTPGYEFSRSFTVISSQFGIVDCGFVDMAPYWDNCFDFDPYTKISIFLPFIGFREINADEVMGGKIGVVYHVDVVTGDCVAFITISAPSGSIYGPMQEKVIGEHHGNCGVQVPIGRVSHDAAVGASLNLMTTFAGMAVGAAAGYAGLAAPQEISESQVASQLSSSTMTAVEGMKTKVERAGALGGNSGYMGNRKPYLIRQIPRQSKPDNYKQICGYPCNKPGPLSNFETGTLACVEDIQLNNIPAMETEREEIIQFLKGGVIL